MLKSLATSVGGRLRVAAQHQQQRSVGNLPVKPNKYIEEWATRRENIEHEFKWDAATIRRFILVVGVLPYLFYRAVIHEYNVKDDMAGRQRRPLWGQ